MATARWFDEKKVAGRMVLPYGVPMRDLSDEEWEEYPEHVQRSIDTWDVFRKTNPAPAPRRLSTPEPEQKEG